MSINRRFALWPLLLLLASCTVTTPRPQSMPAEVSTTPIQHWLTRNGARVYFVPAPDLPMLDVRVVFDAGSARDGERSGLALLTNGMLDQGAGDLDADGIAGQMESLGARMGNGSARDMAWLTLRTLSDPQQRIPALDLFATVLAEPRFPERDFQRERQRVLVSLQQQEQKAGTVASKAFYRALYGEHPYASPESGTPETVSSLTVADLRRFYEQYYVARNAVVALVGDMDRATAESIAEQLTSGLPAGEAAAPVSPVPSLTKARDIRIAHPSTQSHVLVGQPGMRRGDPDYFVLYVGNHVLGGGGLVSRIIDEIREQRGLSYSAYSYFLPMGQEGPFIMGLQTRNAQVEEALTVLRDTLARFRDEGPTEKELVAAKRNITGGFPLRIDSNSDLVEYLAMIGFYGLPLDYLDQFNGHIDAVTREQVQDAFQRRLHPERMVTVVVGGGA